MARIGIMGGTFNPVHNVHLMIAEEARKQFRLKKVLFMPSKNPPHKEKSSIVSEEHRRRMIEHAIEGNPYFVFSGLELERDGTTYTKDTLSELSRRYPDDKFYFILGGDSLASMEKWREPKYIFEHCHILAANRGETDADRIRKWISHYKKKYDGKVSEIQMPSSSVSSEMIRDKLADGMSVTGYVPDCVERYIRFHGLYHDQRPLFEGIPSDREIIRCLSALLKPKRFLHTLSVAATAANMAGAFGYDERDAFLAGLLHDCAKYLTGQELVCLCEEEGVSLTDVERANTALIHGKFGAHLARVKYHIEQKEILDAICYHTTGRPDMGALEKIIYLADYMEPGRVTPCQPHSLADIRSMCFRDLDRALKMVLECCVTYLESADAVIDPLTMETYRYYSGDDGKWR